MLKSFITNDTDLPNTTGIPWLDTVIKLANEIAAKDIIKAMHRARFKNEGLSDVVTENVLKTFVPNKP